MTVQNFSPFMLFHGEISHCFLSRSVQKLEKKKTSRKWKFNFHFRDEVCRMKFGGWHILTKGYNYGKYWSWYRRHSCKGSTSFCRQQKPLKVRFRLPRLRSTFCFASHVWKAFNGAGGRVETPQAVKRWRLISGLKNKSKAATKSWQTL